MRISSVRKINPPLPLDQHLHFLEQSGQMRYTIGDLASRPETDQRVTKALNDGLQAALAVNKTPAQALGDAQAEGERILKPYRT